MDIGDDIDISSVVTRSVEFCSDGECKANVSTLLFEENSPILAGW